MKIGPVGAELFHADRQTDRQTVSKLTVALRNFPNAPQNAMAGMSFMTSIAAPLTPRKDRFYPKGNGAK